MSPSDLYEASMRLAAQGVVITPEQILTDLVEAAQAAYEFDWRSGDGASYVYSNLDRCLKHTRGELWP